MITSAQQCLAMQAAAAADRPSELNGFLRITRGQMNNKSPRVGCAGIVRLGSQVLLGKRNKDPNRGLWVLPGGGVGFGETLVGTLQRELAEEAGIEVDIENIFDVSELITPPDEHRVIIYVNARYRSGKPVASSDLSEVRFFQMEEIQRMSVSKLISPFVETVLRKAALL